MQNRKEPSGAPFVILAPLAAGRGRTTDDLIDYRPGQRPRVCETVVSLTRPSCRGKRNLPPQAIVVQ